MNSEEQIITEIVQELERAWNGSDSRAFAAQFADDASFIHIFGGQLDGRSAIEASHRRIFDTIYKGSHNNLVLKGVRFVRPDVAIALVEARLHYRENGEERELTARPTLVATKNAGRWQIVFFQNTKISTLPAAVTNLGS